MIFFSTYVVELKTKLFRHRLFIFGPYITQDTTPIRINIQTKNHQQTRISQYRQNIKQPTTLPQNGTRATS